jgi:GntR family transcriptional regulator
LEAEATGARHRAIVAVATPSGSPEWHSRAGQKVASSRYKYVAVRDSLRDEIIRGVFAADDKLPSESALGAKFGVSRVTVRLALDALRKAGLLESRQGKGYFVRRLQVIQDLGRLQGFGEIMAPFGIDVRSEVIELGEVPASAEVQRTLAVKRGTSVVRICRVRIIGGAALSYDVSHFPIDIGERLARLDLSRVDIFALLEGELGIEIGYADIALTVVTADELLAQRLGIAKGDPLVRIVRLTHDREGRPIDFEHIYARPDSFQFRVRGPRW